MVQKISLLELNKSIQEKIKLNFPETIWVVAEISELKVNRNGHCYIELIEKDAITENIIAKNRATIWAFTFRMLKPYFESITGHQITSGLKVLVQVSVEFHELYGFSLNITDIDPNYTLGDLVQKKAETLRKLEEDGIINMNKELNFPLVPQKIAIISSETAAGYQDFINQLINNKYGFKYYHKIFPAIMQGLQAEESIINTLEKIFQFEEFFDIIVIIRGGGSQADLNCFNNYFLASNVAQFPVPVITGIGHEKDESIVDLVAHKKLKTPTAVAEFIIEKTLEFEQAIDFSKEKIYDIAIEFINHQNARLTQLSTIFIPLIKNVLEKQQNKLSLLTEKFKSNANKMLSQQGSILKNYIHLLRINSLNFLISGKKDIENISKTFTTDTCRYINHTKTKLDYFKKQNELLDPRNILKRGYSVTYSKNNTLIKKVDQININDEIITKLFKGKIRSTVKNKN